MIITVMDAKMWEERRKSRTFLWQQREASRAPRNLGANCELML
jgi:hypothetical protein